MAIPAHGNCRGLAARVRLLKVVLASAMMIMGLSCSSALYAIKKTGRNLSRSSSSFLQYSFQRFMGFLAENLLAVLCVLAFFAFVYTMVGKIKIWQRSRRQAGSDDGSSEARWSHGEDERSDFGKKGSTGSEEGLIREWDLEKGMKSRQY